MTQSERDQSLPSGEEVEGHSLAVAEEEEGHSLAVVEEEVDHRQGGQEVGVVEAEAEDHIQGVEVEEEEEAVLPCCLAKGEEVGVVVLTGLGGEVEAVVVAVQQALGLFQRCPRDSGPESPG